MSVDSESEPNAVFISYTHVDNQPFGPNDRSWISFLDDRLTTRLQQLSGDPLQVWRDPKLQGNDVLTAELGSQLAAAKVLLAVCSPRYLKSDWCRRELEEFMRAADSEGAAEVDKKRRIFKVLKTPVKRKDLPEPLAELLGYEFYEKVEGDRIREFLLEEKLCEFYTKLDDVAQDIVRRLEELDKERRHGPRGNGTTIYMANATSDVSDFRESMKRELEQKGHMVLPDRELPLTVEGLTEAVNADLKRSHFSIHFVGARYGPIPEGEDRSIQHLQLALAADGLCPNQFVWIPDELHVADQKQRALIDDLNDGGYGPRSEVVRASRESFRAHFMEQLDSPPPRIAPEAPGEQQQVYLVYDRGDREAATELREQLEDAGLFVAVPLSRGTEADARRVHEEELTISDAVLIYYGTATEYWLRMKHNDLRKAPGWGRTKPFRSKKVWVAPPATPADVSGAVPRGMVLDATGGRTSTPLESFLAELGVTAV